MEYGYRTCICSRECNVWKLHTVGIRSYKRLRSSGTLAAHALTRLSSRSIEEYGVAIWKKAFVERESTASCSAFRAAAHALLESALGDTVSGRTSVVDRLEHTKVQINKCTSQLIV